MKPSDVVFQVSSEAIRQAMQASYDFFVQARYKQAVGTLSTLLNYQSLSLVEKILILGQRAWVYVHWKSLDKAKRDCDKILQLTQAEITDLHPLVVDWETEKMLDIGYLQYLAQIYHLRGMIKQHLHQEQGAVEDLTMALFMSEQLKLKAAASIYRGLALINLNICLPQAIVDFEQAYLWDQEMMCKYLALAPSEQGIFEVKNQKVYFSGNRSVLLSPEFLNSQGEKFFLESLCFQGLKDCYYKPTASHWD